MKINNSLQENQIKSFLDDSSNVAGKLEIEQYINVTVKLIASTI